MQRTAAQVRSTIRTVPRPVVINVSINEKPARALLDPGSLGDFISSTLTDQLQLKQSELPVPLPLQLAVQGSRSKVNCQTTARLKYEDVNEDRVFDVINISQYDLILGTPWLYQHCVSVGLNPARVMIGSDRAKPLEGKAITSVAAHAINLADTARTKARELLIKYAEPLCKTAGETGLPPLRAITVETLITHACENP